MDIARKKTMAVAKQYPNEFVVGADTIVEIDGKIIGNSGIMTVSELYFRTCFWYNRRKCFWGCITSKY